MCGNCAETAPVVPLLRFCIQFLFIFLNFICGRQRNNCWNGNVINRTVIARYRKFVYMLLPLNLLPTTKYQQKKEHRARRDATHRRQPTGPIMRTTTASCVSHWTRCTRIALTRARVKKQHDNLCERFFLLCRALSMRKTSGNKHKR